MMKQFNLALIILILGILPSLSFSKVETFFTPHEGKQGFGQIYKEIEDAKKTVEITVYSWSAAGLEKAIRKAIKTNNPEIRMVLHPKLFKKASIQKTVKELQQIGVRVKVSTKDMHEKFVIVDDLMVMNTSGNFSNGAQNKYSENLIFHYDDGEKHIKELIDSFETEFEILWNFSKPSDKAINYANTINDLSFSNSLLKNNALNSDKNIYVSSSMNFDGTKVKSANSSRPLKLRIKSSKPWTVRDAIIAELDKAQESVVLCLNHFFIKEIADKLIEIHRDRGVEVKFAVDNQEYKSSYRGHEVTPYFVQEWLKLNPGKQEDIPVRVKFYSHNPSHRYWALNHHKFMIVDYGTENQVLINGSYNLSEKAEQGQFDNMVIYKGDEYAKTIDAFYGEFENMWNYNRNADDSLDNKFFDYLYRAKNGFYPIHHYSAQSLTWDEMTQFRKDFAKKMGVRYISIRGQKKHCRGMNPKKGTFSGCP